MRRAVLNLSLLLAVVAGCATAERRPPEIRYVQPTEAPASASAVRVRQPSRLIWQQLLDRLQQSTLRVERADELAGLIVATYSGDPVPYVNCGWIMAYSPEAFTKTPGSVREMALDWPSDGQASTLKRSLELDGRLVVQVRPADPDNTMVAVESTYVLTKTIAVAEGSAPPRTSAPEFVSFKTGERGKFAMGTVCQPTGELERVVLGVLPADIMSADASRGAPPAPSAAIGSLAAGLDCAGTDLAYCQALEIVEPYQQANEQQQLGLALKALGGRGPILTEGEVLTFDVSFPNFDTYLHVAYLQRSGVVGHIMPGAERLWPANAKHYVERTPYEIAPPYGVEMILAIASQQPLFPNPRPRFESATDYLAALRQRLADLAAVYPGIQIAAAPLLIETKPRQPAINASF